MAGFLEVPEDCALTAFCRALARAIKAGDVSADGIVLVSRDGRDPATALEIGSILRAVYFSHVVTTTASAEDGSRNESEASRQRRRADPGHRGLRRVAGPAGRRFCRHPGDRKSPRLNSSH